eukprot:gnl/TRDRNA2_/TRDRNA2_31440_c0_seq1.p2 gnl/TRDRNA2_/TRDRNA2_31440_c0~~gnl/TRDRNA2_/TRDRNA2_31440_c0_seq1.p2  ORF type:complete len:127 (+),score=26.41 gnl/TRDRNA2_/TRDRNA2_31440_c0_seq1:182-562(+)
MQHAFEAMDHSHAGVLTVKEFHTAIQDEGMVAYFGAFGLDITEVQTLFVLLDRDQDGTVDIEEFLLGCLRLKGEAKSLDIWKLSYESEWLISNVSRLITLVEEQMRTVDELVLDRRPSQQSIDSGT